MFRPDRARIALVAAGLAVLGAAPAAPAPQVLALIGTDRPVALDCRGADCIASLPAVCLQPERRAPEPGREYRLATGRSLALVGDGAPRALGSGVRLRALRTHVAVVLEVPRALIGGLRNPAVHVGPNVSAVPVPDARDARPLAPTEIAEAVGRRRAIARRVVEGDPLRMPTVRAAGWMVNHLRAGGDVVRGWSESLDAAARGGASPEAIDFARGMRDLCDHKLAHGLAASLPACLEALGDEAMEFLNTGLEAALKAGS